MEKKKKKGGKETEQKKGKIWEANNKSKEADGKKKSNINGMPIPQTDIKGS